MRSLLHRVATRAEAVAPLRGWALLGGVYVVALVINAARWNYGPDTRFYLAWAYRFGGLSEREAGQRTYDFLNGFDWFADFCWYACDTSDPSLTYDWLFRGREGGLVSQRVVYPLLSAPFVRLFGPPGMLVIPVIAYTALVVLVVVLASRLIGRGWAIPAGFGVVLPVGMVHFALYAYTEAIAMALVAAIALVLPLASTAPTPVDRRPRRDLAIFAALLVVFAYTRQFHYVVALGVVCAWLWVAIGRRNLRNAWAPFALVAVGLSAVVGLVQARMSPGFSVLDSFLQASGAGTLGGVPGVVPGIVWDIIVGEAEVGGQDFGFVLVVLLGLAGMVLRWRSDLTALTLGMAAGTLALEILTTEPSQNRYWAPLVPLLAIHATRFLARILAPESKARHAAATEPAT